MKYAVALVFSGLLGFSPALAADTSDESEAMKTPIELWLEEPTTQFQAADINLDDFKWQARPIVVFADTEADPRFLEQIQKLEADTNALIERDVVIIVDTNPADRTDLRTKLRPRGFQLTLIGKDGGVKLRKPFPWDTRELSRQIDKMPMRQQEIRAGG